MLSLRMFKVESTDAKAMSSELSAFKASLDTVYQPLLSSAVNSIAQALGAEPALLTSRRSRAQYQIQSEYLDGEVYLAPSAMICVALRDERPGGLLGTDKGRPLRVEVFVISQSSPKETVDNVLKIASTIFSTPLESFIYKSDRFNALAKDGHSKAVEPSAEERDAVALLKNKEIRSLALAVKASGGLLIRDLQKHMGSSTTQPSEMVQKLKDAGLVDSEIVVICSKSQAQVARVPSVSAIAELTKLGMKCACGRKISEEKVEEALSATDLARSLLDKARWMTILLIDALNSLGIPRSSIIVEHNLGGDEIDCIANISGELVLFELKDKEFNLGNAYSFGAKLAIVKPRHPIIVTTEHVGGDAKEHFNRAKEAEKESSAARYYPVSTPAEGRATDITYIEGLENLAPRLSTLVSSIYRADAFNVLDKLMPLGIVGTQPLLTAFESIRIVESSASQAASPLPEEPDQVPDPAG